jgi:endo-1,4-beta-xylanase
VTWGLDDRYSWYNLWHDRYFKRWDGKPTRPLLFDQAFQPKPAFDAVLSALQHAPPRRNTRQK